ncbi:hypothetical protein Tco_0859597 [Tanacetum coccineum]|uniref:Uncharacterized protein n=1 Tax=Tanacetum coccineum TaxID=301880 RepID=A0ABQ5BCF0_9ASTR
MPTHNRIYIAPSHTMKIFGNMRRLGKGFSGREIPLFPTMVVQNQAEMGEGSAMPTDPHHTPTFIQPSTSQPQKKQKPRKPKRKDTQIPQSSGPTEHVADAAVYKELDDSLVRAATTASSLEAEQDSGNKDKTQSKATLNEPSSPGTSSGNTLRSGEDSLKLKELMELCTNLQTRVLDLEKTKTTQAEDIINLKRRVKKLEHKKRSRTHRLKRLYKVGLTAKVESFGDEESLGEDTSKQGRINAIVADEDITLVNDQDDADMFTVNTLTAQAIVALKSVKPKVKANVVEEPSVPVSAASTKENVQDKGKGILVEEPVKPKKKDLIRLDEEIASKLQADSSKRVGKELEQESSKKHKVEEDKESEELNQCLEIIPDDGDDVTIDATPLSIKSPTIVE